MSITRTRGRDTKKRKYKRRSPNIELQDADLIPRTGRQPKAATEVTSDLLASGLATMAQIAKLFETDAKTLPQRMKQVVPRGKKGNYKLYNIREAAAFIVPPGYEIEDFIRQASPQEMPPLLLKEFWNGQNARAKYEKEMGNLWETAKVVEAVGSVFSLIRMTLLLFADDIDREDSLTDTQREIVRRMVDGLIVKIGEEIEEKFKDYDPTPNGPAGEVEDELIVPDDDDDIFGTETESEEDIDI